MGENTNTLFWVITGAVIVVALFVLIENKENIIEKPIGETTTLSENAINDTSQYSIKHHDSASLSNNYRYINSKEQKVEILSIEKPADSSNLVVNWKITNVSQQPLIYNQVICQYKNDTENVSSKYSLLFSASTDFTLEVNESREGRCLFSKEKSYYDEFMLELSRSKAK